jgi:hypothetical protein
MDRLTSFIAATLFISLLIIVYRFGYDIGVADQKRQTDFIQQQYNTLLEIQLDCTIIENIPDSAFIESADNSCKL